MKIGKETFTVLPEKPSVPPKAGYIFVYSWKDKLWYMDSYGQEYLLPGTGGLINQLVSGGYTWVSGLTFDVFACLYLIQGTSYENAADTITLDAADDTYDRQDVIYLGIDGLVGKITGVPGENPAKPLVNPLTQLELTSVIVPAQGTEPGGISNGYVYQENTEWTTSSNAIQGITVNFNSTTTPYAGTKCIEVKRTSTPASTGWRGQWLKFVRPTGTESILNSALVLHIKNALRWRKGDQVEVTLHMGTNTISAVKVIIKDGAYGFDSGLTTWQKLVIPIADFAPVSYSIDTVVITFNGVWSYQQNVVQFDEIFFQAGNTQVTGHDRLHDMTNPLDHKPVAAADYNKIPHTNALTGVWELITLPTGTDSAYVYIAYASDDQGTGFTLTFNPLLDYIAIKSTTAPIANPQASDFTGLWKNYKGTPGTDGDDGLDGDDAYVYIAYASSDAGAGFTMTFDPALDYIAIRATTAPIAAPQASDFTGLWKNYKGAPGDSYNHWDFNVDTTDNGDVNTPITSGEKIYFKEGDGIQFIRTTHAELGHVLEVIATGKVVLPSANASANGIKIAFTANENHVFGNVCYINATGKAQKADKSAVATSYASLICLGTVAANGTGIYLKNGYIRNDAWNWDVRLPVYLDTAGGMTQTAPSTVGHVAQVLAIPVSATVLDFSPSLSQVEYK